MTMQQFYRLSEMEKVSAILQFGRLMTQTTENNSRTFLYHFETFYVSASYEKTNDRLRAINCALQIDQLMDRFRQQLISVDPAEREYDTPDI